MSRPPNINGSGGTYNAYQHPYPSGSATSMTNSSSTLVNSTNNSIAAPSMATTLGSTWMGNGGSTNGAPSLSPSQNEQMRFNSMTRAERFEDEKRRIIESCFSKLDPHGQLTESYITHIRVQEDGQYPSTPSPPDSNPDNKKPRLVIIAVRSTGRVRMHKARENNNGSFSIGKTWNLEELAAIESFSNSAMPPQSELEAQYRSWAGGVGFTVIITKPYYWQAGTAKEKQFFIASAVKIYRKYTKGQVPELRGFDEAQKAAMLGGNVTASQSPPPQAQPLTPPAAPFASQQRSQSPARSVNGDGRGRTESPARRPVPGQEMSIPKPFATSEHSRSYSPVGSNREQRPSASSATTGASGLRSPPPNVSSFPRAPSQQSSTSNLRADSPANTSTPPPPTAREANRPPALSGPRQPSAQSTYSRNQDHSPAAPLPPLDTYPRTLTVTNGARPRSPISPTYARAPESAESGLGQDATTFASLTGYLGPEQSVAGATLASAPAPAPLTPPRSRRRPTLESSMSDTQVEAAMRPAPLNSNAPARTMNSNVSPYNTSRDAGEPAAAGMAGSAPQGVLQMKHASDTNLPIPGAIQRSAMAPSPLSTPAHIIAEADRNVEEPEAEPEQEEEEFRPGLGPMIKRKAVAERLRSAAVAANAFKPRPGGVGAKILQAKAEREAASTTAAPDGISGVVPRPSLKGENSTSARKEDFAVKEPVRAPPRVDVNPASPVTTPAGGLDGARGMDLSNDQTHLAAPTSENGEQEITDLDQNLTRQQPVPAKIKRRSATQERYLDHLGIDRSLLADKCLDFEALLYASGWETAATSTKALQEMESHLRREQSRFGSNVGVGAFLSAPAHETSLRQEREKQVLSLLDRAIHECDEMDGLLTIYNVELSSLNDDIAYIEAQSQGLQVQAANQRNLQTELTNLVQTLSLDRRSREAVRHADLGSPEGVADAEASLKKLYTAIVTIDPSVRSTSAGRPRSRIGALSGEEVGKELNAMAAVRQKQDAYLQQANGFCKLLDSHLDSLFASAFATAKAQVLVPAMGPAGGMQLNSEAFNNARRQLWMFGPLILFAKDLRPEIWTGYMGAYASEARGMYADAFGQNVAGWKRAGEKGAGDDGPPKLFTALETDDHLTVSSVSGSARKLTVKRSQTLAKTLRKVSDERPGSSSNADSRATATGLSHGEVFARAMNEMAPLIRTEQNFIIDLFHASSLSNTDFLDACAAAAPVARTGTDLVKSRPVDPDREMARRVTGVMDEIFAFFTNELLRLLDWSVSLDPIQGVGVMTSLSRHGFYLQDSGQDFLLQLIETLSLKLNTLFTSFVDDQVHAIEETKVKIKKRTGVIGIMRVFPDFSAAVEGIFHAVGMKDYEIDAACLADVRTKVDAAMERVNRALFDVLMAIAKEGPGAHSSNPSSRLARAGSIVGAGGGATDDPEDKDSLYSHVLVIENMNHYLERVDDAGRKAGVLARWKGRAERERGEAMEAYVAQVCSRPLGKVLVSFTPMIFQAHSSPSID